MSDEKKEKEKDKVRYCTSCGKQIDENSMFCNHCGESTNLKQLEKNK